MNIPTTQAAALPQTDAAARAGATFDPFDLTDPFPFYRRARAEAPIVYSSKVDSWVFFRYEDIKAIFNDWKAFSSENAQSPFWPLAEETQRASSGRAVSKGAPGFRRVFRRNTPACARSFRGRLALGGLRRSSRKSATS